MPNWTDNTLTINNLLEEEIQDLKQVVNNEKLCDFIVPSPDWSNTPNENGEFPVADKDFPDIRKWSDGTQDLRWYDWNLKHWGTKWGDCDGNTDCVTEGGTFYYSFQTAWSPLNENFLRALSLRFPRAEVTLEYLEPNNDFLGASVAQNGEVLDRCVEFSSLEEEWFEARHKGEVLDEDEREECWYEEQYEFGWEFLGKLSDELKGALAVAV